MWVLLNKRRVELNGIIHTFIGDLRVFKRLYKNKSSHKLLRANIFNRNWVAITERVRKKID